MLVLVLVLQVASSPPLPPWERAVAAAAPRGAIDCGVGRDEGSDALVDRCASDAVAHRRPFFCVFRHWPGPPSDVITTSEQTDMGYVGDGKTVAAITPGGRRVRSGPWQPRSGTRCGECIGRALPSRRRCLRAYREP